MDTSLFSQTTINGTSYQEFIESDWRTRGFSFGVWTDPPGQVWRDFVHAADELIMVAEGELELTIDGRTLRVDPGQEVLIPAGTRHTVRNVASAFSVWFYGYRLGR